MTGRQEQRAGRKRDSWGEPLEEATNTRARIGQARRQKTLEKLTEAAVLVFSERGLEGTVIDHVVQRAGLSRGTFYNYFETIEGVLDAARVALGREVLMLVDGSVDQDLPVGLRLSEGLHAFIALARHNRLFLDFTTRLGWHSYSFSEMLRESSPDFLAEGIEEGTFHPVPEVLVFDLLEAGVSSVLRRIEMGEEVDVAAFVAAMLRMLGMGYAAAQEAAARHVQLPEVPQDSLLARGSAVWERARQKA